jgi:hypothetical protein
VAGDEEDDGTQSLRLLDVEVMARLEDREPVGEPLADRVPALEVPGGERVARSPEAENP